MSLIAQLCQSLRTFVISPAIKGIARSSHSLSSRTNSSVVVIQSRKLACLNNNTVTHLWRSRLNNVFATNQSQTIATTSCVSASLQQMHKTGPHIKKRSKRRPTDGRPFLRGVILKTLIKKPRKPNSANRKCVRVRLSNGKEATAYIPGEGHNLQEHNIVLLRGGRLQDVPGVHLKCVRGKYDLPHVKKPARM